MIEHSDSADNMKLGAYLDGELLPKDRERLEERLTREPRLAKRLERMRSGDEAVRGYYGAIDDRPLPARVMELLGQGPATAAPEGTVVPFPRRAARSFLQYPVAIAASVALIAGYLVAGLMQPTGQPDARGTYARHVEPGSELERLLETGVGPAPQTFADGSGARVLLTFADADGHYCRHVRVDGGSGSMQGLACRQDGGWRMEAAAFGDSELRGGIYQPASSSAAAAITTAIDARIGDREPLDAEAEALLISSGWKNTMQ